MKLSPTRAYHHEKMLSEKLIQAQNVKFRLETRPVIRFQFPPFLLYGLRSKTHRTYPGKTLFSKSLEGSASSVISEMVYVKTLL